MANTRELDRQHWPQFFKRLSDEMRDRPVRIEVDSPHLGQQEMGEGLSFQALSFLTKGSEEGAIELSVEGPFDHRIARPVRVYVEEEAGVVQCLDIEDASGTKTLLFFETRPALEAHPMPPVQL